MAIRHTPMAFLAASELSFTEMLSLLSLSLASMGIIANTFRGDGEPLIASLAFSGIAFAASYAMIRWLGPTFMKAGLKGKDMSKVHKKEIPETMGAVCAVVYMLIVIVFIPFPFYKDIVAATSGGGNRDVVLELDVVQTGRFLHRFPHSKLASYLSAILSLQSVILLGVGDDLFDIRWRHKFFIPGIASIPLLIVYFVDFGTLLLLFVPQIFNFVYSAPQLFRLIPCPRHRLPRFNARTGLMEASVTEWAVPPSQTQQLVLTLLHRVRLLQVTWDAQGVVVASSNFTILNLWLVWFGPKREDRLALEILGFQMLVGLCGLFVRHNFALLVFESDNLKARWR
ncbi:UDP-N-acetylglucosamine-1-P transferase [Diplocarpon rosae]|nr:UDP-N-acetylglucosamine-1-P transferase [Diplocarpon rosae]